MHREKQANHWGQPRNSWKNQMTVEVAFQKLSQSIETAQLNQAKIWPWRVATIMINPETKLNQTGTSATTPKSGRLPTFNFSGVASASIPSFALEEKNARLNKLAQ